MAASWTATCRPIAPTPTTVARQQAIRSGGTTSCCLTYLFSIMLDLLELIHALTQELGPLAEAVDRPSEVA